MSLTRQKWHVFGPVPGSVSGPPLGDLRQWIARLLVDQPANLIADVQMVATELVTNAYEYAAAPWSVRLRTLVSRRSVMLEVDDCSPELELTEAGSTSGPWRGHGLKLVRALSVGWGARRGPVHKTVWARLSVT